MEQYIYIDILFLFEGLIHCFLLFSAGRFCGVYRKFYIILLGGLLCSLVHIIWLIIFFPSEGGVILSLISISLGIIITYFPKNLIQFSRLVIASLFSSFMLGGGINVLFMTGKTQEFLGQGLTIKPITFPWYYLVWSTILGYLIIKKCEKYIESHITKRSEFTTVILKKNNKVVEGFTLIDTGNGLEYKGKGVIIMDFAVVMGLFDYKEVEKILKGDRCLFTSLKYNSLGNDGGDLWGFQVEECICKFGESSIVHKDFFIGISFEGFVGDYDGLTPTYIFKEV